MSVPKQRRTSGSKKRRASHFSLKKTKLNTCEKCEAKTLPHHACPKCGYYRGKKVEK